MKIKVNGIQLNYEKIGMGKPLILLHGNGEDHHIFDELALTLKDKFTLYLVDSRNHGLSSITRSFHYEEMAEDVHAMTVQLKLSEVSIFGFSDGGIIGLILASKYPDSYEKMIIAGANLNPTGLKKTVLNSMKEEYEIEKNPYLKLMLEEPNISNSDLDRIIIPVLVLAGEKDVVHRNHTYNIHRALKKSKLLILKQRLHGDYVVHSIELEMIIKDFI